MQQSCGFVSRMVLGKVCNGHGGHSVRRRYVRLICYGYIVIDLTMEDRIATVDETLMREINGLIISR